MLLAIRTVKNGIQFPALIQPRSSRNKIAGIHTGALKIFLTAPPVNSKANEMCIKIITKLLDINSSRISITSGMSNRHKIIQINDLSEAQLTQKLQPVLSGIR